MYSIVNKYDLEDLVHLALLDMNYQGVQFIPIHSTLFTLKSDLDIALSLDFKNKAGLRITHNVKYEIKITKNEDGRIISYLLNKVE